MHDQTDVAAVTPENTKDLFLIANVSLVMRVPGNSTHEGFAHPGGRGFLAEKFPAHAVIYADHVHTLGGEVGNGFGPYQSS